MTPRESAHEHYERSREHLADAYRRHQAGGELEEAALGYAQAHAMLALANILGDLTNEIKAELKARNLE